MEQSEMDNAAQTPFVELLRLTPREFATWRKDKEGSHRVLAGEYFHKAAELLETKDARIAQLEKEKALAVEALENVNKVCLCTRGTKGFDYGQKHKLRGKAGVGERWNTPNYICVKALAQIKEMEK